LQEKIQGLGISEDFETSDEPPLVNLQGISVEAVLDVLESFRKAEDEYLCEHSAVYISLALNTYLIIQRFPSCGKRSNC
jgi:hypothetical protein